MSGAGTRRRPSPGTIIAVVALFVALGSGAYAASRLPQNSVGSKTIKKGAVKTRNLHKRAVLGRNIGDNQVKAPAIKKGAVTTSKASFISSGSVSASNATTSNEPTDLGGPSVTVTVASGDVVELFAQAQISVTGGGAGATGDVELLEPTLVPTPQEILASGSSTFQTRYTSPGTNDANGVIGVTRGGWITLAPPPGTYTFSLRYEAEGGGTATFQNRTLLVRVTH